MLAARRFDYSLTKELDNCFRVRYVELQQHEQKFVQHSQQHGELWNMVSTVQQQVARLAQQSNATRVAVTVPADTPENEVLNHIIAAAGLQHADVTAILPHTQIGGRQGAGTDRQQQQQHPPDGQRQQQQRPAGQQQQRGQQQQQRSSVERPAAAAARQSAEQGEGAGTSRAAAAGQSVGQQAAGHPALQQDQQVHGVVRQLPQLLPPTQNSQKVSPQNKHKRHLAPDSIWHRQGDRKQLKQKQQCINGTTPQRVRYNLLSTQIPSLNQTPCRQLQLLLLLLMMK